jgi:hypothetical protein
MESTFDPSPLARRHVRLFFQRSRNNARSQDTTNRQGEKTYSFDSGWMGLFINIIL